MPRLPFAPFALLLCVACQVGGGEKSLSWSAEGVGIVDVTLSSGEINVLPGTTDEIYILWEGGGISSQPIFEVTQDGPRLYIDADCGFTCGGELTVELPHALPLELALDSGEANVELTERSSVSACVAAGEVNLLVPSGAYQLDLDAGAGSIDTEGVFHDATAKDQLRACVAAGEINVTGAD